MPTSRLLKNGGGRTAAPPPTPRPRPPATAGGRSHDRRPRRERFTESPDHGDHRPGWLVPGRVAARARATRCTGWCARPQHRWPRAHRAPRASGIALHPGRPARPTVSHDRASCATASAGRGLQPGRRCPSCRRRWTQPVLDRRAHRRSASPVCSRRSARAARRHPLLPGQLQRDVRQGAWRSRRPSAPPFYPRSPYGVAKLYGALDHGQLPRDATACTPARGILFNHESPRRGLEFVTRKITWQRRRDQARAGRRAAARQPRRPARLGLRRRTTSRAMWLMLQQDDGDDYVLATGVHPLGARVRGDRLRSGRRGCREPRRDRRFADPARRSPASWSATPSKARERLSWEPETSFDALIRLMTDSDY